MSERSLSMSLPDAQQVSLWRVPVRQQGSARLDTDGKDKLKGGNATDSDVMGQSETLEQSCYVWELLYLHEGS